MSRDSADDVGHYDLLVSREYSRGIEPGPPTRQAVSLKITHPVPQRKHSRKRSNDISVEITVSPSKHKLTDAAFPFPLQKNSSWECLYN